MPWPRHCPCDLSLCVPAVSKHYVSREFDILARQTVGPKQPTLGRHSHSPRLRALVTPRIHGE
jgi:hypothetical protein